MDIADLQGRIRQFADERDWHRFHSPKNISMALSVEVAELVEHFQWLTEAESASPDVVDRLAVAAEIADVQIYLLLLADKLNVDLDASVRAKMTTNAGKYPAPTGLAKH